MAELFEKREVTTTIPRHGNQSMLTLQLQQMKEQTHNPFSQYSKYDGKASGGQQVKKIDIFLTMATPQDRPYPMPIVTLATTKVEDLIGFICWQYTFENRLPQLLDSVECYALHIAEDDGEVDLDFPALDNREPISKFGFAKLALVERQIRRRHMSQTVVTIYMPNRGFSKIPIDDDSILMRELLDRILTRRKLKEIKGLEYRLEKQNEPGAVIDLEKALRQMPTMEFCLVRENSTRADVSDETAAEGQVSAITVSLTSHQYKSYNVVMLNKIASNVPVQLGISGEKVEIDPKQSKSVLFRHKAMTCDIDAIASCELLTAKEKSGKLTLRLVCCQGTDFKHYDFECLAIVAKEIVNKVNNIMELRSSPKKKEYQDYKERKSQNPFKRHSLSFS